MLRNLNQAPRPVDAERREFSRGSEVNGREPVRGRAVATVLNVRHAARIAPAPERPLTPAQSRVLSFIIEHLSEHGYSPTLRELCARFGWGSTNGANDHLRALERKGWITREDMVARSIVLTEKGRLRMMDLTAGPPGTPCPHCGQPMRPEP